MAARGTLVDSKYQWNPGAAAGVTGGTVNPGHRIVKQGNVSDMFKGVSFSGGKANIGGVSNRIFDAKGAVKIK